MEAIRLALCDDHELIRKSLAKLLSDEGIDVLYDAGNGKDLQHRIRDEQPDVVLMDIHMPEMDGIATTAWLKQHHPEVKVIALSVMDDERHVIRMLRAGARAYLVKNAGTSELLRAIREVHERGYHFSERVSGTLISRLHTTDTQNEEALSDRELEFLHYCCSEMTYKEIGAEMNVSPRTAEGYAKQLCEKLSIKSRIGLVLYAIRNRLYQVE